MLGNSNISNEAIKAETGLTSNKGKELVGAAGLNKYSYYAPGQLSVDADKNIVLIPPVANYKTLDYRSYDHFAVKPSILTPAGNLAWGPEATYCSFTMNYRLEQLNLYAFADRGDYVTMDFYASPADRINRVNLKHRQKFTIPVVGDVPLSGHSRQSLFKPATTGLIQCVVTGFETSWLGSATYVYVDSYISDLANNRKINFGTNISDGYSYVVLQKNEYPYLVARNTNVPTPPAGYTAVFPQISGVVAPVCSYTPRVDQNLGTTYAFNIVAKGIYGTTPRIVAIISTDIIITLDGVRTVVAVGVALSYENGTFFTGTLAGGGTWNYNKVGEITFENAVISSGPAYTQC